MTQAIIVNMKHVELCYGDVMSKYRISDPWWQQKCNSLAGCYQWHLPQSCLSQSISLDGSLPPCCPVTRPQPLFPESMALSGGGEGGDCCQRLAVGGGGGTLLPFTAGRKVGQCLSQGYPHQSARQVGLTTLPFSTIAGASAPDSHCGLSPAPSAMTFIPFTLQPRR